MATTLGGDLAQHIILLNKIRAAVPALRKGQYTFDGCRADGSGYAFRRAYRESYALVAVNGGATFSNVPEGTYTDIVTGTTYTGGGSITIKAPSTKGQLRVLVKDWTGGKLAEDGKFIYTDKPVAKGGNPTFPDVPASRFYTADDAIDDAAVILSPAGGSFTTPQLTVSASLNVSAVSGWYRIADGTETAIEKESPAVFTIGADMDFNETVTVQWSATDENGNTYTGNATYRKADPNASITIFVKGKNGADISGTNLYAWGKNRSGSSVEPCGKWPGTALKTITTVDGEEFYSHTFTDMDVVNIIFNKNGSQTRDIVNVCANTYYEYDGASDATEIQMSGIAGTQTTSMRAIVLGGVLHIISDIEADVDIYNLTGVARRIHVSPGITAADNLHGFHIVLGKKIMLP